MLLIADSGSTKTQWCIVDGTQIVKQIFTHGINPYYQSREDIRSFIDMELANEIKGLAISDVHYYGAGCNTDEHRKTISDALTVHLPGIEIEVNTDLLGSARSLFGKEAGIACILGTGSNSCYYDGENIVENVSPLGFILGDEGSGAVLGRFLVGDCLKNQLPEWLRDKFLDEYELTPAQIMEHVYRRPFPNRFLAQFAPFMAEHLDEPIIFNQVFDSFDAFVARNVLQYQTENLKVGFTGSVAANFRDVLEMVLFERGLEPGEIIADPIPGLIRHHSAI